VERIELIAFKVKLVPQGINDNLSVKQNGQVLPARFA
jgi:hypothetical protein